MYPIGSRLLTLDGSVFGNAIIYDIEYDPFGHPWYLIETDFGNRISGGEQYVDDHWSVNTSEDNSLERWYSGRDELRSRSSMAEQGSVAPQDVGSVPTVIATFRGKEYSLTSVVYLVEQDSTRWIYDNGALIVFQKGNQL